MGIRDGRKAFRGGEGSRVMNVVGDWKKYVYTRFGWVQGIKGVYAGYYLKLEN